MAHLKFTNTVLPSQLIQLNENGAPIQSKEIAGCAIEYASSIIDNMHKERGTFQSMKHNNTIQKAIKLFEPHTITIKEHND